MKSFIGKKIIGVVSASMLVAGFLLFLPNTTLADYADLPNAYTYLDQEVGSAVDISSAVVSQYSSSGWYKYNVVSSTSSYSSMKSGGGVEVSFSSPLTRTQFENSSVGIYLYTLGGSSSSQCGDPSGPILYLYSKGNLSDILYSFPLRTATNYSYHNWNLGPSLYGCVAYIPANVLSSHLFNSSNTSISSFVLGFSNQSLHYLQGFKFSERNIIDSVSDYTYYTDALSVMRDLTFDSSSSSNLSPALALSDGNTFVSSGYNYFGSSFSDLIFYVNGSNPVGLFDNLKVKVLKDGLDISNNSYSKEITTSFTSGQFDIFTLGTAFPDIDWEMGHSYTFVFRLESSFVDTQIVDFVVNYGLDNALIGSYSCSIGDFGCQISSAFNYLFNPSSNSLNTNTLTSIKNGLMERFPFNYVSYVSSVWSDLASGTGSVDSLVVHIGSQSLTIFSPTMLSTNPVAPLIRGFLNTALYLFLIFAVYKRVVSLFDNKTIS